MLGFVRGTVTRRVVDAAVLPVSVNVVVSVSEIEPFRSAARALALSLHVIVTVPAFLTRLTAEQAVAVFAARADERYVARWFSEPAVPTRTELISDTDEPERTMLGAFVKRGACDEAFFGVTAADAADAGEMPAAFSAVAVKV